mmetsp:Transcript_43726/g.85582  ORF Transcript_43726/g.85582 Transcript_43726/m.85582 type:complete len:173 (-) Transcript_43726:22-540(-)
MFIIIIIAGTLLRALCWSFHRYGPACTANLSVPVLSVCISPLFFPSFFPLPVLSVAAPPLVHKVWMEVLFWLLIICSGTVTFSRQPTPVDVNLVASKYLSSLAYICRRRGALEEMGLVVELTRGALLSIFARFVCWGSPATYKPVSEAGIAAQKSLLLFRNSRSFFFVSVWY